MVSLPVARVKLFVDVAVGYRRHRGQVQPGARLDLLLHHFRRRFGLFLLERLFHSFHLGLEASQWKDQASPRQDLGQRGLTSGWMSMVFFQDLPGGNFRSEP